VFDSCEFFFHSSDDSITLPLRVRCMPVQTAAIPKIFIIQREEKQHRASDHRLKPMACSWRPHALHPRFLPRHNRPADLGRSAPTPAPGMSAPIGEARLKCISAELLRAPTLLSRATHRCLYAPELQPWLRAEETGVSCLPRGVGGWARPDAHPTMLSHRVNEFRRPSTNSLRRLRSGRVP
jgi:hypothetical protein